jgi:hypothetical protein
MEPLYDVSDMPSGETSPGDYIDAHGHHHIMCACGHWVTTAQPLGTKIALCPNCAFQLRFGGSIPCVWPDRMP